MSTLNTKKSANKNKLLYLVIAGLVALAAAALFVVNSRNQNSQPTAGNETATHAGELAPATEEEKAQAEAHKEELANTPTPQAPTPANPTKVTPLITYAGQSGNKIEVIAFTPGISEPNGICKLAITQGSQTINKQVVANRNSTTTDCSSFSISRVEFPTAGTWSAVVSYESPTAKGSSEPYSLNIQ